MRSHDLYDNGYIEFSHSLETQIAGQLRAGFTLLDLKEGYDRRPDDILSKYAPSYIATKSIKPAIQARSTSDVVRQITSGTHTL